MHHTHNKSPRRYMLLAMQILYTTHFDIPTKSLAKGLEEQANHSRMITPKGAETKETCKPIVSIVAIATPIWLPLRKSPQPIDLIAQVPTQAFRVTTSKHETAQSQVHLTNHILFCSTHQTMLKRMCQQWRNMPKTTYNLQKLKGQQQGITHALRNSSITTFYQHYSSNTRHRPASSHLLAPTRSSPLAFVHPLIYISAWHMVCSPKRELDM